MFLTFALLPSTFQAGSQASTPAVRQAGTPAVRMVDIDQDGRLDRLTFDSNGGLGVAMNRSGRVFESIAQTLPRVPISSVLAGDLTGDGWADLYLVSPGENVALVGDGTGFFTEATGELGLADGGYGLSAERTDIDQDGIQDVLLRNLTGDVVFWGTKGAFERDPSTPTTISAPAARPAPWISGMGFRPMELSSGLEAPPLLRAPASPAPGTPTGRAFSSEGSRSEAPTAGESAAADSDGPFVECTLAIRDVSTNACIRADSTPTMGRLLPLGPMFFVEATGEVGVGTTSPANRLSVAGTADVSGALGVGTATPANELSVLGNADVSGNLGVGTASPNGKLSVVGNVDITGSLGIGGPDPQSPLADLHVVGNAFSGAMIIAPDAASGGSASLELAEDRDAVESFRLLYDGAADQLQVQSDAGTPTSRLAVARDTGIVGVGTTDLTSTSAAGAGLLRVTGDVTQSLASAGAVKASCHVDGTGVVSVTRSFNQLPGGSAITVARPVPGQYVVDFGVDVSSRFYIAVVGGGVAGVNPTNGGIKVTPRSLNVNALSIVTFDAAGVPADNDFYLVVF